MLASIFLRQLIAESLVLFLLCLNDVVLHVRKNSWCYYFGSTYNIAYDEVILIH